MFQSQHEDMEIVFHLGRGKESSVSLQNMSLISDGMNGNRVALRVQGDGGETKG